MERKVNIFKININILISARELNWKGRPNGAMRRVGNLLFLTQGLLASGSRICPHSSPVERLLLFSRRQQQQQCFIMTEPGGGVVKKSLAEWSLAPSQLVSRLPVDPDTENRIRRNVPGAVFSKGRTWQIFLPFWFSLLTYSLEEILRSSQALFISVSYSDLFCLFIRWFCAVLRIRYVCPGFDFFHPGSRIHIKECQYFNPTKWFQNSRKYDPGCSSRIRIPDPGVKKAPYPRFGIGIRNIDFVKPWCIFTSLKTFSGPNTVQEPTQAGGLQCGCTPWPPGPWPGVGDRISWFPGLGGGQHCPARLHATGASLWRTSGTHKLYPTYIIIIK